MNVPWYFVFNNPDDLEGCVQTWNKLFLQVAEDHAPTKTRRVRGTPTPWMTSEIATLMRDRNYHLTKAKGNKTNCFFLVTLQIRHISIGPLGVAAIGHYSSGSISFCILDGLFCEVLCQLILCASMGKELFHRDLSDERIVCIF